MVQGITENAQLSNSLGDAAEVLAAEIARCHRFAERCLDLAWHTPVDLSDIRGGLVEQAEKMMRLSAELAGALAKLKGDANTHRQLISVERIDGARASPPPADVSATAKPTAPVWDEPSEEELEHEAFEKARAALALAEYQAEIAARGEGGGRIPQNESLR